MPVDRKVGAGALAGAVTTIVVWGVGLGGVDVPPEVAAAATTVFGFAIGWLVPNQGGNA